MYLVLSILYESWLQPVLILTALPLATVGAFLGLLVFGQTLSLPAFIGLIALFGLVGQERDPAGGPRQRPPPAGARPDDGAGAGRAARACARS